MYKRYVAIILSILITLTLYPTVSFGNDNVVQNEVNGSFTIGVLQGEKWINAGSMDFGRFYSEKQIDIREFIKATGKLEVKITKIGGGSSHIDAVLLEDTAPAMVSNGEGKDLTKVLKPDFDVINIDEEGLIFLRFLVELKKKLLVKCLLLSQ